MRIDTVAGDSPERQLVECGASHGSQAHHQNARGGHSVGCRVHPVRAPVSAPVQLLPAPAEQARQWAPVVMGSLDQCSGSTSQR